VPAALGSSRHRNCDRYQAALIYETISAELLSSKFNVAACRSLIPVQGQPTNGQSLYKHAFVILQDGTSLFFARCPPLTSEEEIQSLFKRYGTVTSFNLFRRWATAKTSKGKVYAEYLNQSSASRSTTHNSFHVAVAFSHLPVLRTIKSGGCTGHTLHWQLSSQAGRGHHPRASVTSSQPHFETSHGSHTAALLKTATLTCNCAACSCRLWCGELCLP
jgi:hypothetical protein